mmetsp:Transcript_118642/g.336358  ORF Transcript_118642/g.336358 Transcript_118642/m.336358 type:complete len:222 (+) Transcript_118642:1004-1669(+)
MVLTAADRVQRRRGRPRPGGEQRAAVHALLREHDRVHRRPGRRPGRGVVQHEDAGDAGLPPLDDHELLEAGVRLQLHARPGGPDVPPRPLRGGQRRQGQAADLAGFRAATIREEVEAARAVVRRVPVPELPRADADQRGRRVMQVQQVDLAGLARGRGHQQEAAVRGPVRRHREPLVPLVEHDGVSSLRGPHHVPAHRAAAVLRVELYVVSGGMPGRRPLQ